MGEGRNNQDSSLKGVMPNFKWCWDGTMGKETAEEECPASPFALCLVPIKKNTHLEKRRGTYLVFIVSSLFSRGPIAAVHMPPSQRQVKKRTRCFSQKILVWPPVTFQCLQKSWPHCLRAKFYPSTLIDHYCKYILLSDYALESSELASYTLLQKRRLVGR